MDLLTCISGIPNITTAGVACNSTFSMHVLVWPALVKNYSQPLSITPQDHINEFIISMLNSLVVVDFRYISAFLHV